MLPRGPQLDRRAAGLAQHPGAERHDETGALGERDELPRGEQPAGRVLPARQRLEPGDRLGAQVDSRLEVEDELVHAPLVDHVPTLMPLGPTTRELAGKDRVPGKTTQWPPPRGAIARPTRLGRRVTRSSRSATDMARRPALTPSHRNGSGSQRRERWPTQGSAVSSVARSRTRSRSVRPARFDVPTPSPT